MFETKIVSAMEKCFIHQTPADFAEVTRLRMYKNEKAAIQLLVYDDAESWNAVRVFRFEVEGELAPYTKIRAVENIPNYLPTHVTPKNAMEADPTFLNGAKPGLYPDLLHPLIHNGCYAVCQMQLRAMWFEFNPEGMIDAGEYEIKLRITTRDGIYIREIPFTVEILPASLPEEDHICTTWFYTDCLADYYEVTPFSDRHFEICENFIKTAAENGNNMILTPVFTPPLDTAIGGERTTTQLVVVSVDNGKYSFDFSLFDRWVDMCRRCGINYFEISHLFTQWGALHAPKIMATVDGEYKRIFGWETDSVSEEYVTFIRQFLTEFTAHLEKCGLKDKTYFHISDEPNEKHLERYMKNRENIVDILKDFKSLDAISHVEYYQKGLINTPVPCEDQIEDFMKEDIHERWVYYCSGPWVRASNRYFCHSGGRTRSLGMQMYKYGIKGFLHWGYNFYNNEFSEDVVNPFLSGNAGYWGWAGDAYVVYPGRGGKALESIRLYYMYKAFEDIRVMKLCESFYGKEKVVAAIEKIYGKTLTFAECANDTEMIQKIRDKMDDMILEALK